MGSPTDTPFHQQATAFALFAAGNMGLNFFNSWALRAAKDDHGNKLPACSPTCLDHPDFEFPFFYTMFHMLVSSSAALLLLFTVARPDTGMPSPRQFWDYKLSLIPIASFTVLNNGLNNMSLTMVSLFVNQVIKATLPFFVMVFSYFLAQKRYACAVIATVLCLVGGSIMSNMNDFLKPSATETSITGVIVCLISLVASALKPVVAMNAMSDTAELPKLNPTVLLFYDTGISFFLMLLIWLCSELKSSTEYMSAHTGIGIMIILSGSAMAFIFNLANYQFIRLTSALASGIAANAVKIVILIISAIAANVHDALSWTGISIVVLSILAYMYLNMKDKIDALLGGNPPASDPEAGTDRPAKPSTEQTPLKESLVGK